MNIPERFSMGDNKRFHWRNIGTMSGQIFEVYSVGLELWAECLTLEKAKIVAESLEEYFDKIEKQNEQN